MSAMSASTNQSSVPPLTAQEVAVVGEIRQLLSALEAAGAAAGPRGTLKYLTDEILRQTVAERSAALLRARDRYAQEVRRLAFAAKPGRTTVIMS